METEGCLSVVQASPQFVQRMGFPQCCRHHLPTIITTMYATRRATLCAPPTAQSESSGAMLVVLSEHDLRGSGHTGLAGNAPEERKRLVQQALDRSNRCEFLLVERPEEALQPLAGLVHDPGMLRFLESAWDRWAAEWARKPNHHLNGVFCNDTAEGDATTPPPFLAGFFAPKEVGQKPSGGVLGQACYYAMDRETPIHPSTVPSLKWDLAVTKVAAQKVCSRAKRLVYALITHPGHHAGPSSYGGFCFINHAAIAVKLFQKSSFKRVAVLDVDFHAGNGTMAVFWNDPTVFFASIHADPDVEYPYNAGFADQTGGEGGKNTTMNVPLSGGTTWPQYRKSLLEVAERIKEFNAEALVISLGVDTLKGDPVASPFSAFALNPEDYAEMGRILLHDMLCLPTLIIQEGGYKLDAVPDAIAAFLTGSLPIKKSQL